MPLKGDKDISADEAIAQDLCPECGGDLKLTSATGHRNAHWRVQPVNGHDGDEPRRRMKLLDDYITANRTITRSPDGHEIETPKAQA